MPTALSITYSSKKTLLLWPKSIATNIPFFFTALFTHLLPLNQYVCKNITTTDVYILIIPRADLEDLLNDPVYKFSQVQVIYVYYENNQSYEQDQIYFQIRYTKLRFCHERDLPKELDKPGIDNIVHSSGPIDRIAINSFASSVTERVSAKRPPTTNRHSSAQKSSTFVSSHGFSVKNIDQIDSRFICSTCKFIFREPYQLDCGHRTCQACLNVENDKMRCLTCLEESSSQNIWLDKGFRKEMEQLLISCATCDWTETLKLYQEHLEQEHINTAEIHQRNQSSIPASLSSIYIPSNNDQSQNQTIILLNNVNVLKNNQQRIHDELSSHRSLVQSFSQEVSSLRSSFEDKIKIANEMTLISNFNRQEILSLKQKIEDRMVTSYDGTFLWKIPCIEEKIANALSERQKSIYSPPFYSSPYGYKMRMRLYLNGDGDVRGEYLSLFFVLMRGEYDPILQWPFSYKVTFYLIDQSTLGNNQHNISDYFWPDTALACFERPVYDMNEAYGIKKFYPLELFEKNRNLYMKDDAMYIRVEADFSNKRPVLLATSGTGATPNDEGRVDTISETILHIN